MKQPWNARRIWSRLGYSGYTASYFSHASSYRENVASAHRVYSGRKAVVFLPIELSLGVILNIPKTVLSNHAIHSPSLVDIT